MSQLLLFPDPRPLVQRLGVSFFRSLPECPGVYLMRDASETVLYVGKAKNLRKRLGSYRVANPDRFARRHLRLLRSVARIEFERCGDEAAALARESALLRSLRPRFNRAGTWAGVPKHLLWRACEAGLELAIHSELTAGWHSRPKPVSGMSFIRGALARLLWCGIWPQRGYAALPAGWCGRRSDDVLLVRSEGTSTEVAQEAQQVLHQWCSGAPQPLAAWVRYRNGHARPFEMAALEADLELVTKA